MRLGIKEQGLGKKLNAKVNVVSDAEEKIREMREKLLEDVNEQLERFAAETTRKVEGKVGRRGSRW
jgi:tetrahydromethanopterin S-methyltransferase subunit G